MATPERIIAQSLHSDFTDAMLTELHRDVKAGRVSWVSLAGCLAARLKSPMGWESEHVRAVNSAYFELGDCRGGSGDELRHTRLLPLVEAEMERRNLEGSCQDTL